LEVAVRRREQAAGAFSPNRQAAPKLSTRGAGMRSARASPIVHLPRSTGCIHGFCSLISDIGPALGRFEAALPAGQFRDRKTRRNRASGGERVGTRPMPPLRQSRAAASTPHPRPCPRSTRIRKRRFTATTNQCMGGTFIGSAIRPSAAPSRSPQRLHYRLQPVSLPPSNTTSLRLSDCLSIHKGPLGELVDSDMAPTDVLHRLKQYYSGNAGTRP
jgi:hypothetical protein